MITKQELNPKNYKLTEEQEKNFEILLVRMNALRVLYGKAMIITSGIRTREDQIRIYTAKGIPENKIPWGSQHLKAAACDVSDSDGSLMKWCRDNVIHLETIGLWVEDDTSVPRVHFQIVPPKSGNRFFKP